MLLWFIGGSLVIAWLVFHDPAIDYRVLLLGVLLPDVVDGLVGGARVLHSVVFSVALLVVVMLATIGRRAAVAEIPWALIGSGIRGSKLLLPGELLARAPGAEVVDGLAYVPAKRP